MLYSICCGLDKCAFCTEDEERKHRVWIVCGQSCLRKHFVFFHSIHIYVQITIRWFVLTCIDEWRSRSAQVHEINRRPTVHVSIRVGIVGGLGVNTPCSCLQTFIFEWKSALNFNPWAKFQTFRQLTPRSSFRSIPTLVSMTSWRNWLTGCDWSKHYSKSWNPNSIASISCRFVVD